MSRTTIRQQSQIKSSDLYDDQLIASSSFENTGSNIETDLNALRSQVNRIITVNSSSANWYDDVPIVSGSRKGLKEVHELTANHINDTATHMSSSQHASLRQLIHLAHNGPFETFNGAYKEVGPAGSAFPTGSVWYTDANKTHKIVDEIVTYNANYTIATQQWRVYASDGVTVTTTVLDTITYTDVFELSRSRSIT